MSRKRTHVISTELAAVLVDCLAYPPAKRGTSVSNASIPWYVIERGRELFAAEFPTVDLAPIRADWRERESRQRERRRLERIADYEQAQASR